MRNSEFLYKEIGKIDDFLLEEANDSIGIQAFEKNAHKRRLAYAVAATLTLGILVPNINMTIAYAMYDIPVIGHIFRVVTIRRYEENHDKLSIEAGYPAIVDENGKSMDVNEAMETYITAIIDQFKSENDAFGHLSISHEVIKDTERLFTLKINALQIQASGAESIKFYNVDKKTGQIIELGDLFDSDDYIALLSSEIKGQMLSKMEADDSQVYFDDLDVETIIAETQNFYFDHQGRLTIVFSEYQVAPGFMGIVKFSIDNEDVPYKTVED